jgi:hypothetical protein
VARRRRQRSAALCGVRGHVPTFFDRSDSPQARTVFERDASGKVVAQTYRSMGQTLRAVKVD